MDIVQYSREVAFAFAAGLKLPDKLGLVNATLEFHWSNAIRRTRASAAKKYRVKLLGKPHDLWLRTRGGDVFIFHEIFVSSCYSGVVLPPRGVVVDLGANIGLTTLYFASKAPEAQFICVEPVPENAALLRRNVGCLAHSVVLQAAAAKQSGTVAFDDNRPSWGGRIATGGRIQVEAMSIDDLLSRYVPRGTVDLLKIDIEGGEAEIFSGPMPWLDRISCIVAELHPPITPASFEQILRARGFDTTCNGGLATAIRRRAQ